MKLVTVLTVQQAMQLLLHSAYGSRALRSKTAADRCVNLAIHKSGKHGRIHTQPVLQVTLGPRCSVQKTILLKSLIAVFWTLFCPCLCESDTLGECGAINLVSSISSNNQQPLCEWRSTQAYLLRSWCAMCGVRRPRVLHGSPRALFPISCPSCELEFPDPNGQLGFGNRSMLNEQWLLWHRFPMISRNECYL